MANFLPRTGLPRMLALSTDDGSTSKQLGEMDWKLGIILALPFITDERGLHIGFCMFSSYVTWKPVSNHRKTWALGKQREQCQLVDGANDFIHHFRISILLLISITTSWDYQVNTISERENDKQCSGFCKLNCPSFAGYLATPKTSYFTAC